MCHNSFRYETSQKLPATLTTAEHEALRLAAQGIRAAVTQGLSRLVAALSRGAEARRA